MSRITAAPRASRTDPLTQWPPTQLTESGVAALAVQSIHAAVERLYESKKGDRIERDIKDMLSKNGASGYLLDVLAKADIGSELAAETLATLVSIVGTHESSTPAVMMEEVSAPPQPLPLLAAHTRTRPHTLT